MPRERALEEVAPCFAYVDLQREARYPEKKGMGTQLASLNCYNAGYDWRCITVVADTGTKQIFIKQQKEDT